MTTETRVLDLANAIGADIKDLKRSSARRFYLANYQAKSDGIRITDAVTTAANPTVSSVSRPFTTDDIGKTIGVAMPLGTFPDAWISTIQSVSGGVATLATNAPATVNGVECSFGTPDDSALSAALAAAVAAGGGSIVIPDARTILTANILWANGVDLIGRSRETAILTWIRYGLSGIQAPNGYSSTNNQPLTGCTFDGLKFEARLHTNGTYSSSCKPLNIYNVRRVRVSNCWFENTPATAIPCDQSTEQCIIQNNLIVNPGRMNDGLQPGGSGIGMGTAGDGSNAEPTVVIGNSIWGDGVRGQNGIFTENTLVNDSGHYNASSPGYRIIGNFVTGMKFGITDAGSLGTLIEGNTCIRNRIAGICAGPGTYSKGFPGRFFNIQGNTVVRNGPSTPTNDAGYGIMVDLSINYDSTAAYPLAGMGQGRIVDNVVSLNTGSGIGIIIKSDGIDCSDLVIQSNYVSSNQLSGIIARYLPASTAAAGTKGLKNAQINNNVCFNNNLNNGANSLSSTHSGIRFEVNVTDSDVVNNVCYDTQATKTQAYGIFLSTGVTFTGGSVRRNRLRNNKTDALFIVTAPGWADPALVSDNDGYATTYGAVATYVVTDVTYSGDPGTPRLTTRINATVTSSFSNLASVFINGELVSWLNEWGALRGSAHANSKFDALVRAIGRSDYSTAVRQGVGYAVFELLNSDRSVQQWGRDWVSGQLFRNSVKHQDILFWRTGMPNPTTDTTGVFGYGVYTQTISASTFVILIMDSSTEALPTWVPTGRFVRFNMSTA